MDILVRVIASEVNKDLQKYGHNTAITPDQIQRPSDPAFGDYALPCFSLAKQLHKAPAAIAVELARSLSATFSSTTWGRESSEHAPLQSVQAAGPYLNFRVDPAAMARLTIPAILDGSYFRRNAEEPGTREKVMVEYSQPNTHKAFHVGHMRNIALGDALVRLFRYNGFDTVAANYIGDVGTHIAKCLWYYQKHRKDDPPGENRGEWLGEIYTVATRLLEDAPEPEREGYEKEVSAVLQDLEAGRGQLYALWRETREWSLESFREIYRWLDARFDQDFFESEMEKPGRDIVQEGLNRGVFVRSRGAVGIDLEPEGLGFFLVLKSDGTTLYATKDLALARIKFERFGIGRSLYVVGVEQTLHFKQVFRTLEKLGYTQAERSHHLAYGLVMLPEGKMSSRAGNVILFSRLRHEMREYILTHYLNAHRGDWTEVEIEETARRIAVAAIRYGMVKQDPSKTIVFNMEDWLQTEGDTGTYLCYAYTRICSVQKQVPQQPNPRADFALLTLPEERALLRELHDFNETVLLAERNLAPNRIAVALFQLCKEFSRAYVTSPVKQAPSEALRDARLALFAATGRLLREGLGLIGIVPPERM